MCVITFCPSITPGEVFLLLSQLSDDWGWGRSQRTGESGLIPIVIMEDVVSGKTLIRSYHTIHEGVAFS